VIRSNRTKENIKLADIAKLIKQYKETDNIIVKMDIEGAEYNLIEDFIRRGVIKLIDYLDVEIVSI
jgi:hypothetical protein